MIDLITIHDPDPPKPPRRSPNLSRVTDDQVLEALDGSPQAEVARVLGISPPTLHVRLRKMEAEGLVFRSKAGPWLPASWVDCPSCDGRGYRCPS